MALTRLEGIAQDLILESLAPSSRKVYSSAQNTFIRFCSALGVPACPAPEQVLLLFVADLSQRVCHGTIRTYLAAVRHLHLSQGAQDPLAGATRLELALKGIRRRKPRSGDPRLPVTPWILSILGGALLHTPDTYEQLLIWATCCVGFFAFMRSGELTLAAGEKFDATRHMTPRDIAVDNAQSSAST